MSEIKKFNLLLWAGLALSFASLILSVGTFYDVDHLIIVHFDAWRGIDLLGSKFDVFAICGLAIVMSTVNLLLARAFFVRDKFLAWATSVGNLVFATSVLLAILIIIYNN